MPLMKKITIACLLLAAQVLTAQSFDTIQRTSILLKNAIIHTGNGTVYENGVLAFADGKITLAGDAATLRYDPGKFQEIIDCSGKHIYPGLIAMNTQLGLREIELVRATADTYETGEMNANVRSVISYNTDSKVIPTIQSNGILLVQVVPQGAVISGTSSVMETDGWNWEDAVYAMDNGMHLHWPSYLGYDFIDGNFLVTINKNYDAEIGNLKSFFDASKAYCTATKPAVHNAKFEAMRNVFKGHTQLFIHTNNAKAMMHAVLFAKQLNINPVIIGGAEAYKILSFLKEHAVRIVIDNVHALPANDDDDIIQPYKLPAILQEAGIEYAIAYSDSHWNMRNLPFLAGTAVAHGLSKEQALQAITLSPARMLQIDASVGSLEVGKDATLIICEGDLLDMKSSIIEAAYIKGRQVEVKNWQDANYEKFSKKYGIDIK